MIFTSKTTKKQDDRINEILDMQDDEVRKEIALLLLEQTEHLKYIERDTERIMKNVLYFFWLSFIVIFGIPILLLMTGVLAAI